MHSVAVLAGAGRLPVAFARAAASRGYRIVTVALIPETDKELPAVSDAWYAIPAGRWQDVIDLLKAEGIADVYLLGKVQKGILFTDVELDSRCRRLLGSLQEKNDDAIILAFVKDLAREGITVRPQTDLIGDLMPRAGVLSRTNPDAATWADIRYGCKIARAIAGLDIGQTVVIKSGAVVAVEAIEGTDAAIARGGSLAGKGTVVVKVAKPGQDFRFDVPTIGMRTMETMIKAGVKAAALEAEKTFLIDREEVITRADEAGISVVAVDCDEI